MTDRHVTILPDISLLTGLLLIWLLQHFLPWPQFQGWSLWLVGSAMVIAGIALALTVLVGLRRLGTSTNAGELPGQLVTTGAFTFSRNPYYLACACLLLGVATLTGSAVAFLVPVAYVTVLSRLVIPLEEANLRNQFSEQYLEYQSTVNRWL